MTHSLLGPEAICWLGVHYKTLLSSAASNGALSIVDSVSPAGSGPPRHIHHDADESFVVLSGDVEFWLEGFSVVKPPGQAAFVPRGVPHSFRVLSDSPARHLVMLTPGGFEGFFVEMAAGQYRIPEDMGVIEQIAQRYHMSFTGPPLGAE